jgi:hypothetical protein
MLTKADASNWHMREGAHYNGGKEFFAYMHRCVEQPRLSRFDKYIRKDQSIQSTWRTDGIDQPTMEAAIEALNTPPTFDAEELAFIATCPPEFTKKGPPGSINWEVNQRCVDKGAVEWERGEYRLTSLGADALAANPHPSSETHSPACS